MTTEGTNGIDPVVLKRWTSEVLKYDEQLEEQKIENMNICREIRGNRSEAFELAYNAGLPKKAFKAHIEALRKEQRIKHLEAQINGLAPEDEDAAYAYEQMRKIATSGDLFDHAAKKHEEKAANSRTKAEKDAAAAAANSEALKEGIKPIDPDGDKEFDDETSSSPSRRRPRPATAH